MAKNSSRQYHVLSLFSGGMGLDLGLEQTGRFRTVACIEKEPAFCETIRRNRDAGRLPEELQVLQADLSALDPEATIRQLGIAPGSIDVVVGGPPCQSFSTAGRRGTTQDPRGTLLWDFLRFVSFVEPKMFLMENVRGLLSAALVHRAIAERPEKGGPPLREEEEPGSVVRLFAKDLSSIRGGYVLDIFEVNAVNYGAPQLRERALFFGNRLGKRIDFPAPTHGHTNPQSAQASLFGERSLRAWSTLGDALANLEDSTPQVMDFSPRKKAFLARVPAGSNWRSLPEELQKESMGRAWHAKGGRSGWWRRLTMDLPCPTLVTMPNHASTSLCHPTETRALSVREYARIQEFPDDWEFSGTLSQQYAQIGNAVPTRLGSVAGGVIAKELDSVSLKKTGVPECAGVSRAESYEPRIVYLQSHVRTRQWFKDGETIVWESDSCNVNARYSEPKTMHRTKGV